MVTCVRVALVFCLLGTVPAPASDDERITSDLSERATARLFVVPLRIETKQGAESGECTSLGVDKLKIRIRDAQLTQKQRLELIDKGLIRLDRRPRPMLHTIVFDTSGSMSWDLPKAKEAARAYLHENLGPEDQAMILGFDDTVTLWQRVTADPARLLAAVDRIEVAGQTSLYDALVHTIRELDVYRERPVIVLLSDGSDNGSFYDADDVLAELVRRPDLVVFAISIGDRTSESRQILRRIATTTFGRYFEIDGGSELSTVFAQIRDTLGKEAVLTVVDPDPLLPAKIQIKSANNDCKVTILGRLTDSAERQAARAPLPRGPFTFPYHYSAPLSGSHKKILNRGQLLQDINACYNPKRLLEEQPIEWKFVAADGIIRGCVPDIALSYGYLYQPGNEQLIARNEDIQFKIRPFEIPVPPMDDLLRDPANLLEHLLADLPPGPEVDDLSEFSRDDVADLLPAIPTLVHGTTFLEMRPGIVQTLYSQPEYREWALGRLQEWIESDLRDLEARYRSMFPGHSDERIRRATENSAEAIAIRARADAPTEGDLQPFLAAWLGDLDAVQLFKDWELEAISRLVSNNGQDPRAEPFVNGWRRLRDLLAIPSNSRIVAPLIPIFQRECDCIGFYRIVLPRPSLARARVFDRSSILAAPKLDMPPKLPFGHEVLRILGKQLPDALEHLATNGYGVDSMDYELLGSPEFHDPIRAFRETRVRLGLVRTPDDGPGREHRVLITADLHLAVPPVIAGRRLRRPRWLLDAVKIDVQRDPDLVALFGKYDEALAGHELFWDPPPAAALTD